MLPRALTSHQRTNPLDALDLPASAKSNTMVRVSSTPTQEELDDLKLTPNKLWLLDENRINSPEDYELDLQAGVGARRGVA